jgi:excisionase family DNA binding protein
MTNTTVSLSMTDFSPAQPLTGQDRLVYTVSEAGELLGISRAFAYELIARGELPVIKLGRRRLVPKQALHAMVSRGTDNSGALWEQSLEP